MAALISQRGLDLLRAAAKSSQAFGVVADGRLEVRVRMTGLAGEVKKNCQLSATQGFRLCQSVGVLKQLSQVIEVYGDSRMVLPKALLIDVERAPHQGFRLRPSVGVLKQLSQVVEVYGDSGMILSIALPLTLMVAAVVPAPAAADERSRRSRARRRGRWAFVTYYFRRAKRIPDSDPGRRDLVRG